MSARPSPSTKREFAGAGGAWIRDGDTDHQRRRSGPARSEFGGMLVFELSRQPAAAMGRAERARGRGRSPGSCPTTRSRASRATRSRRRPRPARELAVGRQRRLPAAGGRRRRRAGLRVAVPRDRLPGARTSWMPNLPVRVMVGHRAPAGDAGGGAVRAAIRFRLAALGGTGARRTLGLGIGIVYFFLQRMVESGALVFSSTRCCWPGCRRCCWRWRRRPCCCGRGENGARPPSWRPSPAASVRFP